MSSRRCVRAFFSIAYRMLGARADAEDVLQDAWLRWHRADRSTLKSDEAWLVTVVTRLAIDRLRAAKVEGEADGTSRVALAADGGHLGLSPAIMVMLPMPLPWDFLDSGETS